MQHLIPLVCLILSTSVLAAGPRIAEFLAVNEGGLADGDGAFSDWIEIHNPDDSPVDLAGYLLEDADTQWVFPESLIVAPRGYVVIFASGRPPDLRPQDGAGHWHTTFRLGREGETLRLRAPAGEVLSEFLTLPMQRPDVSYGLASNEAVGYFEVPTPGKSNGRVILGYVGDTKFSVKRGYFEEPIEVAITAEPADAVILYTTDGSDPDEGTIFSGPHGDVYEGPLEITETTVLKAVAYKKGWKSSNIDAQTYLFLDGILRQPLDGPEGYPDRWSGVLADYGMDPDVVDDPAYREDFGAAFRAFPSLSIAMDREELFGTGGLYQNSLSEGAEWERATSLEFIFPDDPAESFQVLCGLRIQGGSSRATDIPKHSFSLRFRQEYGMGKLDYAVFDEAPFGKNAIESFDYLQLRSGFNFAWTHRHYYQSRHAQYNRDQFVNDLYLAMGHPGTHGRWFHLYLNGLYWGMYHVHERPDASFMAGTFGGSKDAYDAVNSGEATDGDLASWNAMWALARNAEDPDIYAEFQDYLNVDAFIDYMLVNFFVGNWDWDGHNWRAAGRHGTGQPGQWHFFPWDSEFAISPNGTGAVASPQPLENALTVNRTRVNGGNNRPTGLHALLLENKAYRQRVIDRVQKHFFNDGVMTTSRLTDIWRTRSDLMDIAIIAESARWGDYKRDRVPGAWPAANYDLYTKNDHYLPNQRFILDRYLVERPGIVIEQLQDTDMAGMLPAPDFSVAGTAQHGGPLPEGEVIHLGPGKIYYTVDGSTDPMDPGASEYDDDSGIQLTGSSLVRARARSIFGVWSPLSEAFFAVGMLVRPGDLVISEIHYRPSGATDEEAASGFTRRSDFEFLELRNVSEKRLNLVGLRFATGIEYAFVSDRFLEPGESVVLAGNAVAFTTRYPQAAAAIVGEYVGKLGDGGESLAIESASGEQLFAVNYDNKAPWPVAAAGEGNSLVYRQTAGDPSDASNWQASTNTGGSPGGDEVPEISGQSYDEWRSASFTEDQLGDALISGPLADPDADGRANLLEYVLGSSPASANALPVISLTAVQEGGLIVEWTQRRVLAGVRLQMEMSEDLQTWQAADELLENRRESNLDAALSTVSAELRREVLGIRFLRMAALKE